MWKNYLKIAWRNIQRNKIFSFINIGGLALGLACCILILLYVKDEASFDRFQENGENLYRIKVTMSNAEGSNTIASTNAIHGPTFQEEIPEITEVIRTQSQPFVMRKGDEMLSTNVLFADPGFFEVFTLPLVYGDPSVVLSDIGSIVITEDMARTYFNTIDAVGKVIELKVKEEFKPFTVSGVAKTIPQNSSLQFDSVISFAFEEVNGWTDTEWLGFYMNTFVQLDGRANLEEVAAKMNKIFEQNVAQELKDSPGFDSKISFGLQPFMNIHLDAEIGSGRNGLEKASSPVYSYILSGIGLFLLAIACINFVNLAVARSLKRAKEIGIRKVIGSHRRQLILQFLTESYLMTFIALVLAFVFTQLSLPAFNELANKQLALSYLLDFQLISLFVVLFVVTGLVAGFYPALVLSGFSPSKSLYNRAKLLQQNFLTKALVVFQFTLSICLVVGTIVIFSQFNYLTRVDLGYNDDNLMKLSGLRGIEGGISGIKREIQSLPGVESVGGFNGNYNGTGAKVGNEQIDFGYIGVDDNFLSTMEIALVEGRNFSVEYSTDPTDAIVVNEAFLHELGWTSGVGKEVEFEWKNKKMYIIGVVEDYHYASLKEKIAPLVMTQDPNYGLQSLFIRLNPNNTAGTIKSIETVFKKFVPFMPFSYSFEDQNNLMKYEREQKWKQITTIAAMLSVFVSCIGLFGLAAFNAESRIKEVGVRKVLGASVANIVALLSSDFVKLVLIAIVLAFPIAYYGAQVWLEEFAYQIEIQWWFFGLAGFLGIAVAMLTVGFEALKAALMNPVKSLKSE
ncbi:ABC transporter permease [Algoriphagus sp. D3-2-R+10]|uniref:ABC transporter permease n=1 Tax=Algoriphagus aurantiacus TaxID=3103948 RepID=UPI002B3CC050|nr:ABC transporter permease [Algoriphagus sp. D3-2-R+10]MEB2775072.1 ABC transporter permease [Algoriphagus sp. D3-2-R+10]